MPKSAKLQFVIGLKFKPPVIYCHLLSLTITHFQSLIRAYILPYLLALPIPPDGKQAGRRAHTDEEEVY
jgi:hypothetical protein